MTYVNVPPQGKIEGKFYPLQIEEHMRACRKLTKAQLAVLYYVKTLAPTAEHKLDITVKRLADELGLSTTTIHRALKVLKQQGWIGMERKTGIEFSIDP